MNNEWHKYDMHLYRDSFQNYKVYQIPKAQLIIADVPYNLGTNAYGSNPSWYVDGDNKNGESDKAGKKFFNSENEFRPAEFMHFCSKMLVKEPKEKGKAPCMILFCEFEQQFKFIELGRKYGLPNYINLVFRKDFSAQVLKANMKVVGNCEYGLIFYRDKSLYSRTKKIIKPLKDLLIRSKKVGEMDLSGKNCCPCSGQLYDCFRFFDKEDHFICCVSFDSCHHGTKYSVMDKDCNYFNTDDYSAMVKKLAELLDA